MQIVILFVRMWVEILIYLYNLLEYPVILFVRMWVEIYLLLQLLLFLTSSSSSWGCELKYLIPEFVLGYDGHPLREDVSWNNATWCNLSWAWQSSSSWGCELKWESVWSMSRKPMVILFVRMWVEIINLKIWASSLRAVILFVRMWVEMYLLLFSISSPMSSSSWGCELKCSRLRLLLLHYCHPFREDVSWNNHSYPIVTVVPPSSSSWGCELKYQQYV